MDILASVSHLLQEIEAASVLFVYYYLVQPLYFLGIKGKGLPSLTEID